MRLTPSGLKSEFKMLERLIFLSPVGDDEILIQRGKVYAGQ